MSSLHKYLESRLTSESIILCLIKFRLNHIKKLAQQIFRNLMTDRQICGEYFENRTFLLNLEFKSKRGFAEKNIVILYENSAQFHKNSNYLTTSYTLRVVVYWKL